LKYLQCTSITKEEVVNTNRDSMELILMPKDKPTDNQALTSWDRDLSSLMVFRISINNLEMLLVNQDRELEA
jgi:hypothetical protein